MLVHGSVPRSDCQFAASRALVPRQKRRWLTGLQPATATVTGVLSSANVTAPAAPQRVAVRGAAAAPCRPRPRERRRAPFARRWARWSPAERPLIPVTGGDE